MTDALFNCENSPELPHCVEPTIERPMQESSELLWLSENVEDHDLALLPFFAETGAPLGSAALGPSTRVAEPSLSPPMPDPGLWPGSGRSADGSIRKHCRI